MILLAFLILLTLPGGFGRTPTRNKRREANLDENQLQDPHWGSYEYSSNYNLDNMDLKYSRSKGLIFQPIQLLRVQT